jgi:hypothetical protein
MGENSKGQIESDYINDYHIFEISAKCGHIFDKNTIKVCAMLSEESVWTRMCWVQVFKKWVSILESYNKFILLTDLL